MQKSPHFRLVLAGDAGIFLRAEGRDSRSASSASHLFGTFPARGRLFAADGGVCYMGIKWRMRGFLSVCFRCCYVFIIAPGAVLSDGTKRFFGKFKREWFCGMIIPVPRFRRDTAALLPRGHKTPGCAYKSARTRGIKRPGTCTIGKPLRRPPGQWAQNGCPARCADSPGPVERI